MLSSTLIVNIIATVLFYIRVPQFPFYERIYPFEEGMAAYFGSFNSHCGFNTVDISALSKPSLLLMMLLMFIGAGSASTGGGIKLTTFLIMFLGYLNFYKNKMILSCLKIY